MPVWIVLIVASVLGGLYFFLRKRKPHRFSAKTFRRALTEGLFSDPTWSEIDEDPGEPPAEAQAWLVAAAKKLKIKCSTGQANGPVDGFEVTIKARRGEPYRGLVIRVDGEGRIPKEAHLQQRAEEPKDLVRASTDGVDQVHFDRLFEIGGSEAVMLAILSKEVRSQLIGLAEIGMMRIDSGELQLLSEPNLRRVPAIVRAVKKMTRAAKKIRLEKKDVSDRLLHNAKSRDNAAVRMRNFELWVQRKGRADARDLEREGLTDRDPAFRLQMALRLDEAKTVEEVFHSKSASPVVRARAFHVLARQKDSPYYFTSSALSASPRQLRLALVNEIALLDERNTSRALLEHLAQETNAEVMLAAAQALVPLVRHRRVEKTLISTLDATDRKVVRGALAALGELGTEKAFEAIEPLTEQDDKRTAKAAKKALDQIGASSSEDKEKERAARLATAGRLSLIEQSGGGLSLYGRESGGSVSITE